MSLLQEGDPNFLRDPLTGIKDQQGWDTRKIIISADSIPPDISIEAPPLKVPVDGKSTLTITVTVKDNNGRPKPGVLVEFPLDISGPNGSLNPSSDRTNNNGEASTQFMPIEPGTHTITATVGTDSVSVTVLAPPLDDVFNIKLGKVPLVFVPPCRYEINAFVTWKSNNSTVYNKTIRLETSNGTFDNGSRAIEKKLHDGEWLGGVFLSVDGPATITAKVGSSTETISISKCTPPGSIEPFKTGLGGEGKYDREPELSWSPDGALLATKDSNVHIYQTSDWHEIQSIPNMGLGETLAVTFSPNGKYLAVAINNGWILIYNTSNWEKQMEVEDSETDRGYSPFHTSLAWSDDSRTFAVLRDKDQIRIWDTNGNRLHDYNVQSDAYLYALDWNGDRLAAGGEYGYVYIWNTNNHSLLVKKYIDVHIRALKWSHDGTMIACVGSTMSSGTYNVAILNSNWNIIHSFTHGENANYEADSVDWSRDDKSLIITNDEWTVPAKIFNLEGDVLSTLNSSPAGGCVAWAPHADIIAYAGSHTNIYYLNDGPDGVPWIRITKPDTSESVTASYEIRWEDKDPDSNAQITLYAQGPSGSPFEIQAGISEDDEENKFQWNMSQDPNVQKDTPYHIVGEISDGYHPSVEDESPGTIKIISPPVADFDYTVDKEHKTVRFTDNSTGAPTSWQWDFGDGYDSYERNPTHTYQKFGRYLVTLKVANTAGSDITSIEITDGPVRELSLPELTAAPGDTITVPINITDAAGVAGADIVVSYDKNLLTVKECKTTTLSNGMNPICNTDNPGEVVFVMAGTKPIVSGSGSLFEIVFKVSDSFKNDTPLIFKEAEVYDEFGKTIPISTQNGKIIPPSCVKGDVNEDGKIRSNDAILALRIAARLMTPTPQQACAADVNCDDNIRSNDAILILRAAAGLPALMCDANKNNAASSIQPLTSIGREITVMLGEAHGVAGESIMVPLKVDNVHELAGGDICIAYDNAVLRAVDVSSDSDILLASNIAESGKVRIAFAGTDGLHSKTVAKMRFDILADDVSPLTLQNVELYQFDALPIGSRKVDGKFSSWAIPPENSALLQNFPNPFNPETWIPYQLAEGGETIMRIYNVKGQLVKTLELGYKKAGVHTHRNRAAYWDGKNEQGDKVASGVYFYQLHTDQFVAMRKLILLK